MHLRPIHFSSIACLCLLPLSGCSSGSNAAPSTTATVETTTVQAGCQNLLIPMYSSPVVYSADWAAAIGTTPVATGKQRIIVMNPNSGPGTQSDPDYLTYQAEVKAAHAAGVLIYGYLPTLGDESTAGLAAAKAKVDSYKAWFGVDGIFVDQTSTASTNIASYYQPLATYIASTITKGGVVFNQGAYPNDDSFMKISVPTGSQIIVNTLEGPYTNVASKSIPVWAYSYTGDRFSHIIYGISNATDMQNAVTLSVVRNAGWVYITDGSGVNPYIHVPSGSLWTTLLTQTKSTCK